MVANGQVVILEKPVHPPGIYEQNRAKAGVMGIIGSMNGNQCVLLTETLTRFPLSTASKFQVADENVAYEFRRKAAQATYQPHHNGSTGYTGSDPEIIVLGGDGHVLPAYSFLPHKNKATVVAQQCGSVNTSAAVPVFWDGFQAECVVPKQSCHAYLMDYLRHGLYSVLVKAREKDPKAVLTHQSVVEVPFETMAEATKEQQALGCAPSLNLYGIDPVHIAYPEQLPLRFAGCHIHFGVSEYPNVGALDEESIKDCVRMIDRVAGVISVALLQGIEDTRRREFYGRAGEYRIPKHGLEYRTLSSTILVHPAVAHLMFDLARCACQCSRDGLSFIWDSSDDETLATINNYDVEQALKIIKRNKKVVESIISCVYGSHKKAIDMIKKGAKEHVDLDMMKNWMIPGGGWVAHSGTAGCTFASFKAK